MGLYISINQKHIGKKKILFCLKILDFIAETWLETIPTSCSKYLLKSPQMWAETLPGSCSKHQFLVPQKQLLK